MAISNVPDISNQQVVGAQTPVQTTKALVAYLLLGAAFGVVLTKSEVLSWFRIQEMFRFQSPRMYEIIASAVLVAAVSVALIKRLHAKTVGGELDCHPSQETWLWRSLRAGRDHLRTRLGSYRRMSWPPVRARGQRRYRDGRRDCQRPGRHLALRSSAAQTPPVVLPNCPKGKPLV